MKVKRAALYLRVSTDDQTTENQHRELRAVVERAGWRIFEVYEDAGISGAKGRDQRPAFDQMLKAVASAGSTWSWRGRSIWPCCCGTCMPLAAICTCIDTTTPAGRAMFQMIGVFAELERALIQECVKAGMARAKAQGKHVGRPRGPPLTRRSCS